MRAASCAIPTLLAGFFLAYTSLAIAIVSFSITIGFGDSMIQRLMVWSYHTHPMPIILIGIIDLGVVLKCIGLSLMIRSSRKHTRVSYD